MNRLGIELLTVFGMPPVDFIQLAAELECGHISFALSQFPMDPFGYPHWSVKDDIGLQRNIMAAVNDTGVSLSLGEGFAVRQGQVVDDFASDIDLMYQLGVRRINTVAMDPDKGRSLDQIARFVEMAGAADMEATLEFAPGLTIGDLPAALEAIEYVNQPHFRLLIDTMHLIRSGSSAAQLAAIDPALIGYVQLSDAPLLATEPDYMKEATFSRMIPGAGELPLKEILAVIPGDRVVSLEIPNLEGAKVSRHPTAWAAQCVEAAKQLLS